VLFAVAELFVSVSESAVFFKLAAIKNFLLEQFASLRDKMFSLAVAHKFAICNL